MATLDRHLCLFITLLLHSSCWLKIAVDYQYSSTAGSAEYPFKCVAFFPSQ